MGGDSGGDTQSSVQQVVPWSRAQPYLKEFVKDYYRLSREGNVNDVVGGGPEYYPGQTYVSQDPLQNYAQNLNLAYATQSLPGQVGNVLSSQQSMLNAPDVANNPYVGGMADVIGKRMSRQFTEQMMPRIEGGAVAAGQKGGSREALAGSMAARDVSEATGDALAGLYGQAYGQGLEQQGRGMALAPQTAQMGMMPSQIMSGVGDYRQGIAQRALQADIDRWDYNQQLPYSTLDWATSGANFAPWGQSSSQELPGTSPVAGAVGGGLLGYGLSKIPEFGLGGYGLPLAAGGAILGGLF